MLQNGVVPTETALLPVPAKFSEQSHDRVGHQFIEELVDWLTRNEQSFRTELREINELNFARFEAQLRPAGAETRNHNQEARCGATRRHAGGNGRTGDSNHRPHARLDVRVLDRYHDHRVGSDVRNY